MLRSAVNGGSTTTSAAASSLSVSENASFCTRPMASRCVRFIFQLPAISRRRVALVIASSVGQDGEAGQFPALEVLQGRATAGADVAVGVLVESQLADRRGGVPTA